MKERPMLFSGEMVRAILDGRKTQTRRPITTLTGRRNGRIKGFQRSNTKGYDWTFRNRDGLWSDIRHSRLLELCPFGQVGDRLYVRETWRLARDYISRYGRFCFGTKYRADQKDDAVNSPLHIVYIPNDVDLSGFDDPKWIPSIHMPKWASRITLEITGVSVERAQEITCADAWAEGVGFTEFYTPGELNDRPFEEKWWDDYHFFTNYPQLVFEKLWKSIYGEESWKQNPLVWVIEFKVIKP